MKDEIFKQPILKQFEFDENVASVFDDMISRSVPFYDVSSNLITQILVKYLDSQAFIIDLGCSTGALLFKLFEKNPKFRLCGVDNSKAMQEIAKNKAKAYGSKVEFIEADALTFEFNSVNAVILNYTLQFIRPLKRVNFIKKIYDGLEEGGILILSEKLLYEDKKLSKNMIEIYEEYKEKNGYSKYEIAQKRQALENVLIPFSEDENKKLLKDTGFKVIETIFKWGNFASFMAIKN
ncbi:carboxy-S-adenosyl-L-methionine synthase CmoA [Campylobacter ureolyticus]|uniref:Carboxy-S-adenosyl-L-methionine synthase n=1 Tax=Campylobacter ureolyticus TaxID=827 RepID=A0AAE7EA29_9BACT|nr:carboxy-S-adenosyl-L-methionine synthase CmoA [Campylobacter ureolyticus]MCR8684882.1 carboxy-S-adenosyl-L-methionine synthase CmoA [Campylobacter ureolyticus]QKF84411.1 carboxy-S-adenosyl-L-methionine synthase [Campylobacter ureolyticus]QQY35430.1 carboxy-S-adenosyl-L-methionine synthase CmoA [Campylobacter ureolyticus]SUX22875.1 putative methyltransferase [Campylobacter ureolyticus]